jgi:hypothetical protein
MSKLSKKYGKNTRGKSYPAMSTRQLMRGHRRTQGGPGITDGVPFPILRYEDPRITYIRTVDIGENEFQTLKPASEGDGND